MTNHFTDPNILERFTELIAEARRMWRKNAEGESFDPVGITRWTTSCLHLLDRLSVSTNRFVTEFEAYSRLDGGHRLNFIPPIGVLEAAQDEYKRGLAIDYQLHVAGTVFSGVLDQASYLFDREYYQACAVLMGAALEEALRARLRARGQDPESRRGLERLIAEVTAVGDLTPLLADQLRGVAKMRNAAAHGDNFRYSEGEVTEALNHAKKAVGLLLAGG